MASLYFADQKAKKARGEEQEEKEEKSSDASGSSSQTPITAPSRPTLLGKQRQTIPDAESVTSSTIAPMSFVGFLYNDDASDFESGLHEVDLYVDENPHVVGDKRSGWQQRQEPAPNNHRALYGNTVLRTSHYGAPDPEEEGSWKRASGSTTSGVSFLGGPRSVTPIGTGRVPEHKPSGGSKRSRLGFITMFVLGLAILGAAGAVIGVVVSKTNKRSGNKTGEQEGKVPSPPSNTDLSSSLDEQQSPGFSRPEPPNTSSPTLIARTSSEPTNAPTPLLRITTPAPTPLASVRTTDSVTVLSPPNDECSQATTAILGGRYEGSTASANFDMVGFTGCLLAEDDGPGVWYQIMGTGVPITASTCNSNTDFDTKINVLGGSCEGNDFTCEAANDDACGFGQTQTRVSWFGTEGTLYYVLLSGYGGSFGNYELTFESVPVPNDSCDAAITLNTAIPVQIFPGSTTFAEFDVVKECGDSNTNSLSTAAGVWYRMDAFSDGDWTLSTCLATDFDTRLVVFEGDSCNDLVCVVNNDDGCGEENFGSSVDLAVTGGTSYYVFVSGFNGATGNFTLEVVEQQ